ncbi:MAG: ATP-binding protein [Termitinemataceae bacterium]|nr:MAG: ATP-binding protein [Termitinemataceae bacterium]
MIDRNSYLREIEPLKNQPLVKILAGIRYGGKSEIFLQLIRRFKECGVEDDHIVYLNLENSAFSHLSTATDIKNYIEAKIQSGGKYYLLLDEVQNISGWEKALSDLYPRKDIDIDIYISSSCANIRNIQTKYNRPWVKINVKPFSFSEYKNNVKPVFIRGKGLLKCAISIRESALTQFSNYVCAGGFPAVFLEKEDAIKTRIEEIYSSILFRSLVQKYNIHNIELLERIIKYIFENISQENSAKKIQDHLLKENYNKNLSQVSKHIKYLEDSFILKRIYRYNISSGKILHTNVQYFIEDHSLLNAVIQINDFTKFGIYANIILNDLLCRKMKVFTGKFFDNTIDFVAAMDKGDKIIFIQLVFGKYVWQEQIDEKLKSFHSLLKVIDKYIDHPKKAMYLVFTNTDLLPPLPCDTISDGIIKYIKMADYLLLKEL